MAAEDPLTPGEIRRAIERLERADIAQADRTTQVAAEALTVTLWTAEHRALNEKLTSHEKAAETEHRRVEREIGGIREEIKGLREEIRDLRDEPEKRSEMTWQKVTGLIIAIATLAGVIVTVLGQSKGIK